MRETQDKIYALASALTALKLKEDTLAQTQVVADLLIKQCQKLVAT